MASAARSGKKLSVIPWHGLHINVAQEQSLFGPPLYEAKVYQHMEGACVVTAATVSDPLEACALALERWLSQTNGEGG